MSMATTVMDYLFQRTLDDLVKGLRVQSIGESRYVSRALDEIRKEIKSTDATTKSVALQKLAYLNMLHFVDMSWADFHIVEVMSLPKFGHKKIGYLAAGQCFDEKTEVLLLITNLLRKDLSSKNEHEVGLALEFLSKRATPDLARDLMQEVFTMLASSRLAIRKKATLALLRIFTQFPDGIKVAFKRLVEKLDEPDSQAAAAAVSVLYELARKDPRPYLPLAPELYRLLVESTNNWLCIKLVKMFALLLPLEPRLAKKVAEPLCQQMRRTSAKSLVFECIRTVTVGLLEQDAAVQLAAEKLKEILSSQDDDANLKYLGLQALLSFMDTHPAIVAENKSMVIKCLSDEDAGVRRGSLRLIVGMVSDSNVSETVQILVRFARTSDKSFCNELVSAVLSTCSRGSYELVSDFSWYVNVLSELVRLPHFEQGQEVERQLVDVGQGPESASEDLVETVRRDLLKLARDLLADSSLWDNARLHRVLAAAAWLAGEYVEHANDPFGLVEALLQPRSKMLPPSVQAVYLQAVMKIFVYCGTRKIQEASNDSGDATTPLMNRLVVLIKENASSLLSHVDSEVQERASNLFGLINTVEASGSTEALSAMHEVFAVPLEPGSLASQSEVVLPEGLELADNLEDELEGILCETSRLLGDRDDLWRSGSVFLFQQKKPVEVPQAVESIVSSDHRQRNETYYLPKDSKPEPEEEDVVAVEAAQSASAAPRAPDDDFKAAEESLVWTTTKPRRAKGRPVVIDEVASARDGVVSNAIRNVFDQHKRSEASSSSSSVLQPKNSEADTRKKKSDGGKKRHHHRRQRARSPLQVAPQAAVVPDFLL